MTNILSFDGGFASPLQLRLLRVIEQENPGFLEKTDLFAGVSDGASAALFLACKLTEGKLTPIEIIDASIEFSNRLIRALHVGLCSVPGAVLGVSSLSKVQPFQDALQEGFGDMTLKELTRKVAIVSFDLNTSQRAIFGSRTLFRDYEDLPLYEINWASGALPLFAPVYAMSNGHYYADGGLVDNNPSMAALVGSMSWEPSIRDHGPPNLLGQKVLSLGCTSAGRIVRFTDPSSLFDRLLNCVLGSYSPLLQVPGQRQPVTSRNWGWGQWVLQSPLSLGILLGAASTSGVDAECRELLRGDYFRYAPKMSSIKEGILISFACPSRAIASYDELAQQYSSSDVFYGLKRWVRTRWCGNESG